MTSTAEQLKTLSAYVPPAVARFSFKDPDWQPGGTWRYFFAASTFADISGFTPLAEKLAVNDARGVEELTVILNRVFEALISAAELHGGRVVKFGGDALSIVWPAIEDELAAATGRAIEAAFAMQAALAEAHLTKGDIDTAQQFMQEVTGHLRQRSGSGEYPEQYAWWMYSQIYRITGNTSAADQSLRQAYLLVRKKADQITDEEMRHSFLTNVRVNAPLWVM
jgi:hypothetical protein